MNTAVHFSSASDNWETPQWLFDELNKEFGFDLDAAASKENAKCKKFMSNSLLRDWYNPISRKYRVLTVWLNPPYGKEIICFIEKAYKEHKKGATLVALLPARTDTRWFHDYIMGKAEIRFLKGRLKFGNAKNSAPFPSMIVIFRGVQ